MATIEKIREDLYIKKGWDGYRVVYPIKKDPLKGYTNENINWRNLIFGGHWTYPLKCLAFLVALYFFVKMYLADTNTCREFVKNIAQVCAQYSNVAINQLNNSIKPFVINFTPSK